MEVLTVKDVGEKLHIGKTKAYKLFQLADFPSVKVGSKWIVTEDNLKKFLDSYIHSNIIL